MTMPSRVLSVTIASGPAAERTAAGIWARATALRDSLPEVAPVEDKLLGIQHALHAEGGSLHLATSGTRAGGFAVVVPHGETSEIRYLATDPSLWGGGIATALLDHVRAHALATGASAMELWVIADNERAVQTYERAGWTATAEVEVRHAGGRPERRYVRAAD
ncbi:GNAT family N-acetyltransferase [Sanguibacter sp. 25GB23B1]|uniref:GNAT family N-acetyltransferase n=1 Tax=unclassified Sanguibacter TaxID=2645534 RepID=UPI0032AFC28D